VKDRLRGDAGPGSREAARTTLVTVLDGTLRLLHPIMPFLTTALWERLPWPRGEERPEDLIVAPWPTPAPGRRDAPAEARIDALQEVVATVRSLRKEYGVGEGEGVTVHVVSEAPEVVEGLAGREAELERLARIDALVLGPASEDAVGAHAALQAGGELFLPLAGVVDVERERGRLADEIARLEKQLAGTRGKLANEQFVTRAPPAVVEKEREKERSQEERLATLREKLTLFDGMA
jgi:valyl-tRNA synthetase